MPAVSRLYDVPSVTYQQTPVGAAQLDQVALEVQDGGAPGTTGTACLRLVVRERPSSPGGLSLVRVSITIPDAQLSEPTAPPLTPLVTTVQGAEVSWRVLRLPPSPPGTEYRFEVDFVPQVAATLRLAFTLGAVELRRRLSFVWDHPVVLAGQT